MVRIIFMQSPEQVREEIQKVGADQAGIEIMTPKARFFTLKITGISLKAAILLKQEALAGGGECALHRDVASLVPEKSDALLSGTVRQLQELSRKLLRQPFGLKKLGAQLAVALEAESKGQTPITFNNKTFPPYKTLLMGILNVTPDSFSDGGNFIDPEKAANHTLQMVRDGADIIDIGGESTRPGATPVSSAEELKRVVPVIKKIREVKELADLPLSIDTYKAEVAKSALAAGANMLNDVWGGKKDTEILKTAAAAECPICLMHNRAKAQYGDLMTEIVDDLRESISLALRHGVKEENIIIDPGLGFGKTADHNLRVMKHLREITCLGYPVLLGASRKSMIGKVLNLPPEQRVDGTAAATAYGIACGARIMRVHDVGAMSRVIRMTDAMVQGEAGIYD